MSRNWLFPFLSIFIIHSARGQFSSFNFKYLTTTDGLSDGLVRSITQDKYGFIWLGTSYGLNRFDGTSIKTFFSKTGDSTTLIHNYIQSLYIDEKGNLWVGTMGGLCRFDYSTHKFVRYKAEGPVAITDILKDSKGRMWVSSRNGLWTVDEQNKTIREFAGKDNKDSGGRFRFYINQMIMGPDGKWYIASHRGVQIFDPLTGTIDEIRHNPADKSSLRTDRVFTVTFDLIGTLWVGCGYNGTTLEKINLKDRSIKHYDHFVDPKRKWGTNTIQRAITDRSGRLWVIASLSGISLYDEEKDDFEHYTANPLVPRSLLNNANITLFQDRQGLIWLGSSGYGLCYFNPDNKLFHTLYPPLELIPHATETWSRSACEDNNGNLWLGTANGFMKYDRTKKSFTNIANSDDKKEALHINSVRSVLQDDGDIWVGTARGLNRYHTSTGKMDFFGNEHGIPLAFFWMMAKDRNGTIWMGTASGLFRYDRSRNRFDDLKSDSALSKFAYKNVQALYVDSKNRLWIGLLDIGMVMFDINTKQHRLLTVKDSLITDTRFSSMAEDKEGVIWIGGEDKMTAYDPATHRSRIFSKENGLPSDRTNNIMVDSLNRVWIGTSNGLCVLNAKRDQLKRFDVNDGLLTNQFNEQAAYRTRDGYFIYPTYKGYLVFKPEEYKEGGSQIPTYVTSFRVLDKEITEPTEDLKEIKLRHKENFFSLELAGLNYMNPGACIYAYKLEPFNKEWIYTRKREISYTNVPPGDYLFRYKVVTDDQGTGIPEKTLGVSISQVFYKTSWFRISIGLLVLLGVISFYRYRVHQSEKIHLLQGKAQRLEKEKTLVMYESLKQHLNPHFLFNSLTSLRSLIRSDTKTATNFLDGMSKVYRYVLKSGEQELMSLKDELDFVKTYTELQQTRFNEGLKVNISVDENSYHKNIVPVTLQNLVENAIKHNTADKDSPLVIDIFTKNGAVVVRNNLQRYRLVESSNNRGLANLRSLYLFYSGTPVEVAEDAKHFTVTIPLL